MINTITLQCLWPGEKEFLSKPDPRTTGKSKKFTFVRLRKRETYLKLFLKVDIITGRFPIELAICQ